MGVRLSMDLLLVKKEKKLRKRNHGSFNEVWIWNILRNNKMRQKKIMGVGQSMSLDSMKKKKGSEHKNHGVWKKYGFE